MAESNLPKGYEPWDVEKSGLTTGKKIKLSQQIPKLTAILTPS